MSEPFIDQSNFSQPIITGSAIDGDLEIITDQSNTVSTINNFDDRRLNCCEAVANAYADFITALADVEAGSDFPFEEEEEITERLARFRTAAERIQALLEESLQQLLCSKCASKCCEFAARSLARIAISNLNRLATAVVDPDLTIGGVDSTLNQRIAQILQENGNAFEFILSSIKCNVKKIRAKKCYKKLYSYKYN